MPDDKNRGLYEKYSVKRNDGQELGYCLVLEFKDPNAKTAILAYARTMEQEGYVALSRGIEKRLREVKGWIWETE